MKRTEIKSIYPEEYDYLEFIKRLSFINQNGIRGLEEERVKKHQLLLEKYGYPVSSNYHMYIRSKSLMDNLDVMIGFELNTKVSLKECATLARRLKSKEFKEYMSGKRDLISPLCESQYI